MTTATDVPARARELRSRLDALEARTSATLQHAAEAFHLRDAAVTLTFDEEGLLAGIEVDPMHRRQLSARQLARGIQDAVQTTARSVPVAAPRLPAARPGPLGPEDLAALVDASRAATAALAARPTATPVSTTSEAAGVTVTVLEGSGFLVGVRCDERWLAASPDDVAFHVIVDAARSASLAAVENGRR